MNKIFTNIEAETVALSENVIKSRSIKKLKKENLRLKKLVDKLINERNNLREIRVILKVEDNFGITKRPVIVEIEKGDSIHPSECDRLLDYDKHNLIH